MIKEYKDFIGTDFGIKVLKIMKLAREIEELYDYISHKEFTFLLIDEESVEKADRIFSARMSYRSFKRLFDGLYNNDSLEDVTLKLYNIRDDMNRIKKDLGL